MLLVVAMWGLRERRPQPYNGSLLLLSCYRCLICDRVCNAIRTATIAQLTIHLIVVIPQQMTAVAGALGSVIGYVGAEVTELAMLHAD